MNGYQIRLLLCLCFASCGIGWSSPTVRIICGIPGDEDHHSSFTQLTKRFTETFTNRYGIPKDRIRVTYGPESAGYVGVSKKENVIAELKRAAQECDKGIPQWIVFIGHANEAANQVRFNLPGPDATAQDLADALKTNNSDTPMVLFFTNAVGGKFLKPLAGPGRIVIAATRPDESENETLFPQILADSLEAAETDANGDKKVTVAELFIACKKQTMLTYEKENLIQREHAIMDGDGDGRGTARPSRSDAAGAETVSLSISRRQELLDKFD